METIISYVIKIAQDAKIFDKILLSTDSKIKKIAEKYGAEVPYLRLNLYQMIKYILIIQLSI